MKCPIGQVEQFLLDTKIGPELWKRSNKQGIALDLSIGPSDGTHEIFYLIEKAMNAGLAVEVWSIDINSNYIELHFSKGD